MREKIWYRIVAVIVLLLAGWLIYMGLGLRVLVSERLVIPGQSYIVEDYGDLGAGQGESLVCRYFTGRKIVTRVYHFASNNMFGKDECPFLNRD
ncbi:hypothetical protein [Hydrogenophaga aquatica]